MSNDVTKTTTHQLDAFDGFDGYENSIEGKEASAQSDRGLSGLLKLKFLNGVWLGPNEQEIKAELVVLDVQRKVQKWIDDTGPAETIVLAPGAKFPDIDAMNTECPQSEWREKFGKMTGPWAAEHVVLFVDPATMERYWWPSPVATIGSAVCVRNLVSQVRLMRQFRGQHVYPVVELSHTFMNTAYGGRERPHLEIKRWITFGGGGGEALPAPQTASVAGSTPTAASNDHADMQRVKPLTAKEVTGDEIQY
jgi:hypothetical protein